MNRKERSIMKQIAILFIFIINLATSQAATLSFQIDQFEPYQEQVREEIAKAIVQNSPYLDEVQASDTGFADTALEQILEALNAPNKFILLSSGGKGLAHSQEYALPIYYGYKRYTHIKFWFYYQINTSVENNTTVIVKFANEFNPEAFNL